MKSFKRMVAVAGMLLSILLLAASYAAQQSVQTDAIQVQQQSAQPLVHDSGPGYIGLLADFPL